MTVVIKGRTFEVETIELGEGGPEDLPTYRLTGERGADYRTFRTVPRPERMFLVGFRSDSFRTDPLGPGVVLTDVNGVLEVL